MINNNEATFGNTPALSIIVPVYNTEPWLARCLDSLVNQTIKDLEIIVVDDHSTDGSLDIIREYEKNEPRIHTIALEKNSGVSVARNAGLAIASGEYIGFVDSDDFVDLDFYEKLYIHAEATGADIVKGESVMVKNDGNEKLYGPSSAAIRKNKAEFLYPFWSAMYRTDFLTKNKLDFPTGIITSQDDVFLLKAVILANTIELVEGVYYHYIRREGSLDSSTLSARKIESKVAATLLITDFINEEIAGDIETYNLVFRAGFMHLLHSLYARSNTFSGRLTVIRGAIGLYAKCRYKDDLDKELGEKCATLLSEGNEIGLLIYLNAITKQ